MKILRKHISSFSIFYGLIRWPLSFLFYIFFKKFIITGKENIPEGVPVIFIPNHQCAAVDAYVLVTANPTRQILFLARADVFSKPFLAWLLQVIKILPVFRERDGKDALEKNKEIFDFTITMLENKKTVCIFPEARHNNRRLLLPLKKGVPRIVFDAEEKNNFLLNVHLVPVGIYYSNYTNSGSVLQVNFGAPIRVNKYKDLYAENPAKAMLALREEMTLAMKPLMIDIQDSENYDSIELLRYVLNKESIGKRKTLFASQVEKFKADKEIIERLSSLKSSNTDYFEGLMCKASEYRKMLNDNDISDEVVEGSKSFVKLFLKSLFLVLWLPLFVSSYAMHFLPAILPWRIVAKIKDTQFHNSVKFVLGFLLYPVYYIIFSVCLSLFSDDSTILLIFLSMLLPTALIFIHCRRWYRNILMRWKFNFSGKENVARTLRMRNEIISLFRNSQL